MYAAYTLPLMGVKGASVTPALSYAKGATGTDDQLALRVRTDSAFCSGISCWFFLCGFPRYADTAFEWGGQSED